MNNNKYKEIYSYESDMDLGTSWTALESKLEQRKKRRGFLWFYWGIGMVSIVLFSGFLIVNDHPYFSHNTTELRLIEIENEGPKTQREVVRTHEQNQSSNLTNSLPGGASKDLSNALNGRNKSIDATSGQGIVTPIKMESKSIKTNLITLTETKNDVTISEVQKQSNEHASHSNVVVNHKNDLKHELRSYEKNEPFDTRIGDADRLDRIEALTFQEIQFVDSPYFMDKKVTVKTTTPNGNLSTQELGFDLMLGVNIRSMQPIEDNASYVALRQANEAVLESRKARLTYDRSISDKWFVRGAVDYTEIVEKFTFNGEVSVYDEVITEDVYTDHLGNVSNFVNTTGEFRALSINIVKYNKISSLNIPLSLGYVFNKAKLEWSAISGVTIPVFTEYRGRILGANSAPISLSEVSTITYSRLPKIHHGIEAKYALSSQFNVRLGAHVEYDIQKRISLLGINQRYTSFFLQVGIGYNL